jgi:hypothetical protein
LLGIHGLRAQDPQRGDARAMVKLENNVGSPKADLLPAEGKVVYSKENFAFWMDYSVGCTRLLANSVHGEAQPEIRKEIDHFTKVVDYELSFKGCGHFMTAIMEAFVHADLENSAAMLPLLRYLEQKYNMTEGN